MAVTTGRNDLVHLQASMHGVTGVTDDDLHASAFRFSGDEYITDCIEGFGATPASSRILQTRINRLDSFNPRLLNDTNPRSLDSCDVKDCVDDEGASGNSGLMKWEKNRLESFQTWPVWSAQSPNKLAEAGLYYSGQGDKVICAFCFGILKSWNAWDIPIDEHARHFPRCPFVRGRNVWNVPISQNVQEQYSKHGSIDQSVSRVANYQTTANISTGQNAHGFANCDQSSQAVNLLDFTKESNRLATFSRWPLNKAQTPASLARAGFYHVPCGEKLDRVQCAYCQGKLFNWAETDDPWTEHARRFPECPYVTLCVGRTAAGNLQKKSDDRRNHDFKRTSSGPPIADVTSVMSSAAVMAVKEMGFTSDQVKLVLDKHMNSGTDLGLSAEQLATEILENEDAKPVISGSTNSHSRSRETTSVSQSSNLSKGAIHLNQRNVNPDKKVSESKQVSNWKKHYLCSVCSENQKMVTFLPCGHLTCCNICSLTVTECPVCRTTITGSVRTFY